MSKLNDFLTAAGKLESSDAGMLFRLWKHTNESERLPKMYGNTAVYMKNVCEPPKMVTDKVWTIMICVDVPSNFSPEEWEALHPYDEQKYIAAMALKPEEHRKRCEHIINEYRFYIFENTPEETQKLKFDMEIVHSWWRANRKNDSRGYDGVFDPIYNDSEKFIGWCVAHLVSIGEGTRLLEIEYDEEEISNEEINLES